MKKTYIGIILALCLASCTLFERKEQVTNVVAELNGKYLTWEELDRATQYAQDPADSARMAEDYIRRWAEDVLFLDKAHARRNEAIEQLVATYRNDLYIHQYEEELIQKRMPTEVGEDSIRAFYDSHKDRLVLRENILKGVFLVVPKNAPQMGKLHQWLRDPEKNIEHIESYAYAYASGYQLFLDEWRSDNQVLIRMPFERNELNGQLTRGNLIELSDSTTTYLLQVTDKHLAGEVAPYDYATAEIRRRILAERQVEFINAQKEEWYQHAITTHNLHIYEK